MPRFDRYLLSQFLGVFGFFALVLVLVYWVNRAVGLFDQLIGDGQSALVFLEISLLTLPNVIRLVLPIAAFAAAVFVANRLTSDSELVVMQATGFSAFRLARPVLVFGLCVTLMMLVLMHVLVPASRASLTSRMAEISENVTARFLNDGQFMHPAPGITLYIREITPNGELRDLFLADDRAQSARVTYTAARALLVRGDTGPKLIMFDGLAQNVTRADARLSVTRFADFTYDLGGLLAGGPATGRTMDELPTGVLLRADAATVAETGQTVAALRYEGHSRFATPLLAVGAALIGFAALLLGAFSRFGLWRQILFAVALLIAVQLINTASAGVALRQVGLVWMAYLGPACGVAIGLGLLWWAQRPRRPAPRQMSGQAA
ncbi:MAG: LPS export ABC transporter permease LptF [Rhodobacteraceae bacterium]|nr:LPS export ABC transporter permease LptF [Paracoccaceae bacterium]